MLKPGRLALASFDDCITVFQHHLLSAKGKERKGGGLSGTYRWKGLRISARVFERDRNANTGPNL